MELTLLRHAIPVDPEHWPQDESKRPLTPKGIEQARAALSALAQGNYLPVDAIWSSPLTRCEQTAQIASTLLRVPVRMSRALASGNDLLHSLPETHGDPERWPDRLMLVGHSPDLGLLISHLTGAPEGQYALGRAGTARLKGEFGPNKMKLQWLLSAEQAIQNALADPDLR